MKGHLFSKFIPPAANQRSSFEQLFQIFQQLILIASGDVAETFRWLNQLDNKYKITDEKYGLGNFYDDLKAKGYIKENPSNGAASLTAKSEQNIRSSALEEIFGKLKRSKSAGNHITNYTGQQLDSTGETRAFQFGDAPDQVALSESIKNAQVSGGIDQFTLQESDLEVYEKEQRSSVSTVVMIDISHSMILYGEDRITPAKKVALALSELIKRKYPKDSLEFIVFGNDAWQVQLKDLPYLEVGPYHTNTIAGLELAMDLLRRKKTKDKQIFMITDGKPTCMKEGIGYYKNAFGLDRKIVSKTLTLAAKCKKLNIPVTTFMIASDPDLKQFVRSFTEINQGRAYYSSLDGLGGFLLEDFQRNRRRNMK